MSTNVITALQIMWKVLQDYKCDHYRHKELDVPYSV